MLLCANFSFFGTTFELQFLILKMHKLFSMLLGFFCLTAFAQEHQFTHQDTLKGSITPERAWWDVSHYDLKVTVDPDNKFISGI